MPARIAALLLFASLTLAAPAGAALDARTSLRFSFVPQKAWQEKDASVEIAVRPAGARCSLAVRYADGGTQPGLAPVRATSGRARWTWQVPRSADAGPATVTVACRGVGRRSRTMVVVGGTAVPTPLVVERQGFTQRNNKFGGGSNVGYGLMIANPDPAHDAVEVGVLINFLEAGGRVLGSRTDRVAGIAAGSTYALGGQMSLLTQLPVTRLEVVLLSSKRVPRALHFPSLVAVAVEPSLFDRGWVGAVAGEVVNSHPRLTLRNARLSIVVMDAAGLILGGGSTSTFTPLPPGARVLFKAQSGFSTIPLDRAAATHVSIEPSWAAPD